MPLVEIAGRRISAERSFVTPHEAARLLQVSVREVRNALRRKGAHGLRPVFAGRLRRIDARALAERLDDPIALEVLAALLEQRVGIERPADEGDPPESLMPIARALWMSDRASGRTPF